MDGWCTGVRGETVLGWGGAPKRGCREVMREQSGVARARVESTGRYMHKQSPGCQSKESRYSCFDGADKLNAKLTNVTVGTAGRPASTSRLIHIQWLDAISHLGEGVECRACRAAISSTTY